MPVDYYPNRTLQELQVILERLQDRQTKGGITEVQVAGVRTTREFQRAGTGRVATEILRVLYSLHLRAKGTDQAASYTDPYASKITRTRARYTFS